MRVVIAEDDPLLRRGLELLLDTEGIDTEGITVAAAVGDAEALVAAVAEHRPDTAVVDA